MENTYLKLDELSEIISSELKQKIIELKSTIKTACLIIGSDPASLSYLRGMQKKALKLGVDLEIIEFESNITENDFLEKIKFYNNSTEFCGIIVQVPLPKGFDFFKLANTIDPKKDIDGISPLNQGLLVFGKPFMIPATAWAVDLSLKFIEKKYDYKLSGKNAVIIGRSLTVGKPSFNLLINRNITPTVTHTKTADVQNICASSDIIVACCGVPEYVNESFVKDGAVVIDVGIHSIQNPDSTYKLCGDVDSKSALKNAKIVTAVPGGIGSITSTLLFANALKGYYKINFNKDVIFDFE